MLTISTKDFGGEVPFTKLVSDQFMDDLFETINSDNSNVTHIAESREHKGMRPDIVSSDSDGNKILITECQDASGKLDFPHFSKTLVYLAMNDCLEAVLLCEEVSEEIREQVKMVNNNRNTNFSIHIVQYKIFETDRGYDVSFTSNLSPSTKSRIAKNNKSNASRPEGALTRKQTVKYTDADYYEALDGVELTGRTYDRDYTVILNRETGMTTSIDENGKEHENSNPSAANSASRRVAFDDRNNCQEGSSMAVNFKKDLKDSDGNTVGQLMKEFMNKE